MAGEAARHDAARLRRRRRLLRLSVQVRPRRPAGSDDFVIEQKRRQGSDRPGLARIPCGLRDRLRRRPDRRFVQDPEPERHRVLRLRHQLLALTPLPRPVDGERVGEGPGAPCPLPARGGEQKALHENHHLEHQRRPRPHRRRRRLRPRSQARRALLAGDQSQSTKASRRKRFPSSATTVATHGQKGFNGVALLSLHPLEDVVRGLPGDDTDVQSRYIEATVSDGQPLGARRLDLPAQRQSGRHARNFRTSSAG